MGRQAARTDNTAKALRAYAEDLGFVVVVLNGIVDCLLVWGTRVLVVDWKSKGGTLTNDQAKLVARGVPIKFISTPDQLDALKAEVST
jgi:ATP-dependent exoDNAse (exonuclease V) beta subunit